MQNAGDSTQESSCSTPAIGGIARWFPNGFHTEGVDWSAFEEQLAMVGPDMASEVTPGGASRNPPTTNSGCSPSTSKSIPKGVCAIHFAVSCSNPSAPTSVIQRLLEANPHALKQKPEPQGWNVLHCAMKFNKDWAADNGGDNNKNHLEVLELLLNARPELASEQATSLDDFGLPPLAFAKSPKIATKLVSIMPIKATTTVLKTIFAKRKLVGGSVEAMEQIVRDISMLELQQGQSILPEAILPEKHRSRNQSLIEYVLLQCVTRNNDSNPRAVLMRLVDLIIQATYCFSVRKVGDELAFTTSKCPSPLDCLAKLQLKQKVLDLYHAAKSGTMKEYSYEGIYFDDIDESTLKDSLHLPGAIGMSNCPPRVPYASLSSEKITRDMEQEDASSISNDYIEKLLKCKEELDNKVERSLDVLRQTEASLENYKEMYSKTFEKLYKDALAMSPSATASMTSGDGGENPLLPLAGENMMASMGVHVPHASLPPLPPRRRKSVDSLGNSRATSLNRSGLEDKIQGTIENMTAAGLALDLYNRNLSTESANLVRQQEDLKAMDMGYFKNSDHQQAEQAMLCIGENHLQREGLLKCINEIRQQLKEAESMVDKKAQKARENELNLRWVKLATEIRDLTREIETFREVVSSRRQDLGGYMIKARRILHAKTSNKVVRTRATRFLREAKKEVRELLAALAPLASPKTRNSRKQRRKFMRQKREEAQKTVEEDEELSRMTKRMRL